MGGVMAVWNNHVGGDGVGKDGVGKDGVGGDGTDYEAWYQEEHVPQRLAFEGFRQARRYEAVAAERRYFTWYAVDSLAALHDPAYLACLDDPTPRTRAAMPGFRDMIRAELEVAASAGRGIGGHAVTLRRDSGPVDAADAAAWSRTPGVTAAHVWVAPPGPPPAMSSEARFRGVPDASAAGVLLVECMREADAARVADRLAAAVAGDPGAHVGRYRLLCCTHAG